MKPKLEPVNKKRRKKHHRIKRRSDPSRSLAMKAAWARRKAANGHADRLAYGYNQPAALLESPKQPIRAQILDAAKALTLGDRNKLYGDPMPNLTKQDQLRYAFWDGQPDARDAYRAWGAAMDMVFVKLARIASAPNNESRFYEDHYLDAINYLAIALEVAKRDPDRTAAP